MFRARVCGTCLEEGKKAEFRRTAKELQYPKPELLLAFPKYKVRDAKTVSRGRILKSLGTPGTARYRFLGFFFPTALAFLLEGFFVTSGADLGADFTAFFSIGRACLGW